MGGQENEITLLRAGGVERWRRMTKEEVAQKLVDRINDAVTAPLGQDPSHLSRTKAKRTSS
jgi:hypothetical protein